MRSDDLRYMGDTRALLVDRGVKFTNAFVTTPSCCPSRASIMRGQYTHNHGLWETSALLGGGYPRFKELGIGKSTVATWLQMGGYTTAYLGKYLNHYEGEERPPGWSRWWAHHGGHGGPTYEVNENGTVRTYDHRELDESDYIAARATAFIENHESRPLFMVAAPLSPHRPTRVASRYEGVPVRLPSKPPSFNEADVSDKPGWAQRAPLSPSAVAAIEEENKERVRSLKAVDDLVSKVVSALSATGELGNTYIVFTSDNGWLGGEHKLGEKGAPYEESIRAPLVVRGPGVPQGRIRSRLVANIDLAPTIAEWAGVSVPAFVDGRSLAPIFSVSQAATWRDALLMEFHGNESTPGYNAIRTTTHLYVEYADGSRELYDLEADPYQLTNVYGQHPDLERELAARLEELRSCAGDGCRTAEEG